MGKVYSLTSRRATRRPPRHSTGRVPNRALPFTRSELHQLLSLYSRLVARGEWRDYAIEQDGGLAAFSVFRHSHERPLYTITKRWSAPGQSVDPRAFLEAFYAGQSVESRVLRNNGRLAAAACLDEALNAIEGRLQIVS